MYQIITEGKEMSFTEAINVVTKGMFVVNPELRVRLGIYPSNNYQIEIIKFNEAMNDATETYMSLNDITRDYEWPKNGWYVGRIED